MKRLLPIALLLGAAGCTHVPADLTGSWTREAEEPAMELRGTETLTIRPDSTFTIANRMIFAHADTALTCSLNVTINVGGQWGRTNQGDLLLSYSPQTIAVEPDSASFRLTAKVDLPQEIIAQTYGDLLSHITNYYTQGYTAISGNGGLLLTSPQITDSCLYARINSEVITYRQD